MTVGGLGNGGCTRDDDGHARGYGGMPAATAERPGLRRGARGYGGATTAGVATAAGIRKAITFFLKTHPILIANGRKMVYNK